MSALEEPDYYVWNHNTESVEEEFETMDEARQFAEERGNGFEPVDARPLIAPPEDSTIEERVERLESELGVEQQQEDVTVGDLEEIFDSSTQEVGWSNTKKEFKVDFEYTISGHQFAQLDSLPVKIDMIFHVDEFDCSRLTLKKS